ncbi:MAG: RIP metalloprotease RseP [Desulfobacteraceae bacterium]|nr:RIP metalloprotease RseP [Desulfobacteraceae bacterium]
MNNIVLNFIIVLGVLIFFHELGHFIVARLFGVGVERFSLGFGPRILGKTVGRTDYRISLIPLGGYVKMMGEEPDAPLAPEDLHLSFTHKPVIQRSLIVAAGPLFNVLLAILIYVGGFWIAGIPTIRSVVRYVDPSGPAEAAGIQTGDLIKSINGTPVRSWRNINDIVDENKAAPLNLQIERGGKFLSITLKPAAITAKNVYDENMTYYSIGIRGEAEPKPVVGDTRPDMPARMAGLRKGDVITAIDGTPIELWQTMHDIISSSKGRQLIFTIQRDGQTLEIPIKPQEVQEKDILGNKQSAYRIGISPPDPVLAEDKITDQVGFLGACKLGFDYCWFVVRETGRFFVKLVQGKVPSGAIGGPIRIAKMANQQAQEGFMQFIFFIAFVSVNLAVINLVPIPVLDGGHLLFFIIEAIQRKPVSIRVREMAQQIGMVLLLMLMIFVIYNDVIFTWF